MKKIILIIAAIAFALFIAWVLFGIIMSYGHKGLPLRKVSPQLEQLRQELTSDKVEITIFDIPEPELKNCNAEQRVTMIITEDSLTASKEKLDNYIQKIYRRINNSLINEKCIDSITFVVDSYQSKADKWARHRYSFSVK